MQNALTVAPRRAYELPQQADNDQQLIALWMHGRSAHTQRAYAANTRVITTADEMLAEVINIKR